MNRIIKTCVLAVIFLITTGCATTPPPAPIPVAEPEPEPVDLPKPALLERIPVFAPPPSPAVDSYYNNAHQLPLKEYIREVRQMEDRTLPYKR